jgi:lysophospholipase L1-like esterase
MAPVPQVITITIGGNDLGFKGVIMDCYTLQCDRDGTISAAERYLPYIQGQLTSAYKAIKKAVPTAKIVVVGYPNLFPRDQANTLDCGWLSRSERSGLVTLADDLDRTIGRAAANAGVAYVSTLNVLKDRELCVKTQASWVVPISSRDYLSPRGQLEGHPTVEGQQAIANAVSAYLNK